MYGCDREGPVAKVLARLTFRILIMHLAPASYANTLPNPGLEKSPFCRDAWMEDTCDQAIGGLLGVEAKEASLRLFGIGHSLWKGTSASKACLPGW